MAHILVVDDGEGIRRMVRLTLASIGHTVDTAPDGEAGLDMAQRAEGYDLVLTDEKMPGISGVELVAQLRLQRPALRAMVMTAYDSPALAYTAMDAGASDFIAKPFEAHDLRQAVAGVLSRPAEGLLCRAGTSDGAVTGSQPGSTSFWVHGYRYRPLPTGDPDTEHAAGISGPCRRYLLIGPLGDQLVCHVVVTPHVEARVVSAFGRDLPHASEAWDSVCRGALRDALWRGAGVPPPVLAVYALGAADVDDACRVAEAEGGRD
ncbi:MAG: response regulator [Armatimonadetes bacterium]|nr:response regulator [Armatimonadota bacterium]